MTEDDAQGNCGNHFYNLFDRNLLSQIEVLKKNFVERFDETISSSGARPQSKAP